MVELTETESNTSLYQYALAVCSLSLLQWKTKGHGLAKSSGEIPEETSQPVHAQWRGAAVCSGSYGKVGLGVSPGILDSFLLMLP